LSGTLNASVRFGAPKRISSLYHILRILSIEKLKKFYTKNFPKIYTFYLLIKSLLFDIFILPKERRIKNE